MQSDKFKGRKSGQNNLFESRIFDDLAKVTGGALGSFAGLKKEIEERIKAQFEVLLSRMDLVTREEFEVVKEMAVKARNEQEALKKKIAELEKSSKTKPSSKGNNGKGKKN